MLQAEEDQITSGKKSQSADHTDSLLAQEVNRLSVNERIKALEDVHGVSEIEEEDREVLDAKLKELDSEIGQRKNKAYQLAESFSKDYVTNRDFRLMFLRADSYDAKPAAQRMMKFFEYKLKLFGKEKLIKEITLRDLDKDDIDCLRSGAMQELLHKDRAGRRLFIAIHELRTYKHVNNLVRTICPLERVTYEFFAISNCVIPIFSAASLMFYFSFRLNFCHSSVPCSIS